MSTDTDTPVAQPDSFVFTDENRQLADTIIARYPEGRQASAVLPLLDLAQRQHDGWLPRVAMDHVADVLSADLVNVMSQLGCATLTELRSVRWDSFGVSLEESAWSHVVRLMEELSEVDQFDADRVRIAVWACW